MRMPTYHHIVILEQENMHMSNALVRKYTLISTENAQLDKYSRKKIYRR